jgi:5'-nucleotidase/UDP-sugar diphosphatase
VSIRLDSSAPLLALAALLSCSPAPELSVPGPGAVPHTTSTLHATVPPAPTVITLLYTADEHGWLLSTTDKGQVLGGAAEMLGQWVQREGYCVDGACERSLVVALSGGDNFTGPAVSSYFNGEPMARAMRRMGYVAAAFGNHEFDFGREHFLKNRELSGVPYLAANVHVKEGGPTQMQLPAFSMVERGGIKLGVVGLATDTTLTTAMASRFEGIEFEAEEAALARAIPQAWAAGPDAVIVIAHECPDKLEPIALAHPEWKLSFIGAGHCHKPVQRSVGGVPLIAPGWRLRQYARVRLGIDRSRPLGARATVLDASMIDVVHPAGGPAVPPPDPSLAADSAKWSEQVDTVLGEEIGYTESGLEQESPEIGQWIAQAWREQLAVDVAIVNSGGIRQSVPKGPIRMSTVYSVMPFDNRLVILEIKGSDLIQDLGNEEAVASGVTLGPKNRYLDGKKNPIDPQKTYRIATIDYLYFGGAGFAFQKQDPTPTGTGLDWRTPVIEWTRKQKTTAKGPLEKRIR